MCIRDRVVDMAVDDLKRKLRKLKTFLVDKKRKGGIDEIAKAVAPVSYTHLPF